VSIVQGLGLRSKGAKMLAGEKQAP
jgi:hypothetical protein